MIMLFFTLNRAVRHELILNHMFFYDNRDNADNGLSATRTELG